MTHLMVKACGITGRRDAAACLDAGADLLGCIFHPASPRHVDIETAAAIAAEASSRGARTVGVFVQQANQEVREALDRAGLHLAQLHGGQGEDFCAAVGPQRVVKVLWPERYEHLGQLAADMARFAPVAAYFLLDAGTSGGGHGRAMDIARLANFLAANPPPRPWLLAGGLNAANLPAALAACMPAQPGINLAGVDLNSGVESAPGRKDERAVREAVSLVKDATRARISA